VLLLVQLLHLDMTPTFRPTAKCAFRALKSTSEVTAHAKSRNRKLQQSVWRRDKNKIVTVTQRNKKQRSNNKRFVFSEVLDETSPAGYTPIA